MTRLPLAHSSRKFLRSKVRTGCLLLAVAAGATAGAGAGIAAGTKGIIALLPVVAFLWWITYSVGGKALQDLHAGTEDQYDGPWEQHLLPRLRLPDLVQIRVPTLDRVLTISNQQIVNDLIKAGLTREWSPAAGHIAYTTVNHQTLAVRHGPAEPIAAPPPPNERELHGLLEGSRERARALRRAQAQQPPGDG